MSASADPVRVYWYWRRTLLDPSTAPDQAVAASTIIAQMERWYPAMARSRPPKDEQTGADLSNPWDFLSATPVPSSFGEEQSNPERGQPVNWRRGHVAWVFSPEIPGRYCFVIGATDTQVCVVCADDPRSNTACIENEPLLHVWVARGAAHAPKNRYMTYRPGYEAARTIRDEDGMRAQVPYFDPLGRHR